MSFFARLRDRLFTNKTRQTRQIRRAQRRRLISEQLEGRQLLASSLNLLASGNLVYSGSTADNNLQISLVAGNYRFQDTPEGTVSAIGGLAGLDLNPAADIVEFNPAALALFNNITINTANGNDTVTVNGFRTGAEGLAIQDNTGTDTININTDLGSAGSRLQRPVQLLADTVNLGGSIFTNNQTVNLGATSAAVNLTANVTVDAGTGTVGSTSTINGGQSLTVQGGAVQISGVVGGVTQLTDVSLTATGAGALQAPVISATGDISITAGAGGTILRGNLTAGDDVTITSATTQLTVAPVTIATGGAAGNDINITGSVSGANALGLNAGAGGAVVVGGNIGLTGAATLLVAADSVDFNGSTSANSGINIGTVSGAFVRSLTSASGDVIVNGNVTFDGVGNVTNTAGTANQMSFTGNVTGNGSDLNLRGAQTVSVTGSITNVNTLSVAKGTGTIADATLNSVTAQTISVAATTIHAQADMTATVQNIVLTGNVVLDGVAPSVVLKSGLGVGDGVTITGTVDDSGADTILEMVAGAGGVSSGVIGGTTPIHSFLASGATVTLPGVNVTIGDIILQGGEIALSGNLTGTGPDNGVTFSPRLAGGTLEVYNLAVSPPSVNMTVDNTDIGFVTASIENLTFGSADTGLLNIIGNADPSLVTGNMVLAHNGVFIGQVVTIGESIDQNALTVQINADTLNMNQPIVDAGGVTINKLGVVNGATLTLNGNVGHAGWGGNNLAINNLMPLGVVTANGHLGGSTVGSLTVNTTTLNAIAQPSAIEAAGDITLNVATVNENGGLISSTGDILVNGAIGSTAGPFTVLVPAGKNFQVNGAVNAAGNITVRGRGGALNAASFLGNVVTTGSFQIDSTLANTASLVSLVGSVQASNILVRGNQINLLNNLTATAGSVHLLGPVDLFGNVVMTSSGLANHFVRVDGTINGNFNLESQSGLGQTHFVGVIGGVNPLANLTVRAGGQNFIYQNIDVTGTVDWKSGDTPNAGNDKINVLAGKTITAGVAIILEADSVIANAVTQLFAPSETITNNGNP